MPWREFPSLAPAEAPHGTVAFSMRVAKIDNPAATDTDYSANIVRQVCDLLARTGADNVTAPGCSRNDAERRPQDLTLS
jgi:hypothetical protein